MFNFWKNRNADYLENKDAIEEKKYRKEEGFIICLGNQSYEIGQEYEFSHSIYNTIYTLLYTNQSLNIKIYKVSAFVETNYFSLSNMTEKFTVLKELEWKDIEKDVYLVFPMIENEQEYRIAKEKGYYKFAISKFVQKAIELGHSEALATVVFPKEPIQGRAMYDKMVALNKENISKDMLVYLLLH